ncbi:MAG TPA: T9SS type A sorting domain-containing protein, partial [Chitinophagaceae bacterium]|nr:T9SS type A sorting domain-containing protein [Chitinophagaceae bacterium]
KAEFTLVQSGTAANAELSFKITDLLGRIVMTQKVSDGATIKFGKDLQPGIYFIQLYNADKIVHTEKLIKQ